MVCNFFPENFYKSSKSLNFTYNVLVMNLSAKSQEVSDFLHPEKDQAYDQKTIPSIAFFFPNEYSTFKISSVTMKGPFQRKCKRKPS